MPALSYIAGAKPHSSVWSRRDHGRKLAEPGKVCINVMGDSAIGMVAMDIETAVRNKSASSR